MRTLFILLLSCLPCLAQFGVEQPMFALQSTAAPYSVTNDPAMAYYWNYKDLADGTVTSWPDRKQNLAWVRYQPAAGPTKDANGVNFTVLAGKTTVLTNTGVGYSSNMVVGIVWKGAASPDSYHALIGLTNANTYPFWIFRRWSGDDGYFDWGAPAHTGIAFPITYTTRQFTFLAWSNTYLRTWTNNVAVFPMISRNDTFLGTFEFAGINKLGGDLVGIDGYQYKGSFQELIIWTNVTGGGFDKLLTNYWQYATNTYTFP